MITGLSGRLSLTGTESIKATRCCEHTPSHKGGAPPVLPSYRCGQAPQVRTRVLLSVTGEPNDFSSTSVPRHHTATVPTDVNRWRRTDAGAANYGKGLGTLGVVKTFMRHRFDVLPDRARCVPRCTQLMCSIFARRFYRMILRLFHERVTRSDTGQAISMIFKIIKTLLTYGGSFSLFA